MTRALFAERQARLSDIATADTTFRITTTRDKDPEALTRSIARVGLLSPPVLTTSSTGTWQVVTGFRRLRAAEQLGLSSLPCRTLTQAAPLDCLEIAIADNAWQRSLNIVEQSRAVVKLGLFLDDPGDLCQIAAEVGLSINPDLTEKLKMIYELPPEVIDEITRGNLGLAMAVDLAGLGDPAAVSLARLFRELKLGLNKQRAVAHRIREIAAREGITIEQLLDEKEISQILSETDGDRAHRAARLKDYLDRRRYPAISKAGDDFNRRVKALRPGPKARLEPPPNFEGKDYTLRLSFESNSDLEDHLSLLRRLAESDLLNRR